MKLYQAFVVVGVLLTGCASESAPAVATRTTPKATAAAVATPTKTTPPVQTPDAQSTYSVLQALTFTGEIAGKVDLAQIDPKANCSQEKGTTYGTRWNVGMSFGISNVLYVLTATVNQYKGSGEYLLRIDPGTTLSSLSFGRKPTTPPAASVPGNFYGNGTLKVGMSERGGVLEADLVDVGGTKHGHVSGVFNCAPAQ